jgi:hypothetical protein
MKFDERMSGRQAQPAFPSFAIAGRWIRRRPAESEKGEGNPCGVLACGLPFPSDETGGIVGVSLRDMIRFRRACSNPPPGPLSGREGASTPSPSRGRVGERGRRVQKTDKTERFFAFAGRGKGDGFRIGQSPGLTRNSEGVCHIFRGRPLSPALPPRGGRGGDSRRFAPEGWRGE